MGGIREGDTESNLRERQNVQLLNRVEQQAVIDVERERASVREIKRESREQRSSTAHSPTQTNPNIAAVQYLGHVISSYFPPLFCALSWLKSTLILPLMCRVFPMLFFLDQTDYVPLFA